MAKRKPKPDLSRPITDDERTALEELRGLQVDYDRQEYVVKKIRRELSDATAKLRAINVRLLHAGRALPLFEKGSHA